MTAPVDVVREHFAALARLDWTALENTVSERVQLQLAGTEDWEWSLPTLYRHISQAWNFMPQDVRFQDEGNGAVRAQIRLTNDGDLEKRVQGDYHVTGDRIDTIMLTDDRPTKAIRDVG